MLCSVQKSFKNESEYIHCIQVRKVDTKMKVNVHFSFIDHVQNVYLYGVSSSRK